MSKSSKASRPAINRATYSLTGKCFNCEICSGLSFKLWVAFMHALADTHLKSAVYLHLVILVGARFVELHPTDPRLARAAVERLADLASLSSRASGVVLLLRCLELWRSCSPSFRWGCPGSGRAC